MTDAQGSEELDEARLDLLVPLLELLGIHRQELEVRQPGLVGRVGHLGMPGVETLGVGQHLLHVAGEDEVGEEPGRVRVGREARDGARGDHEGHALLRVDDLDGVPLFLRLIEGVVATVHRDGPLAGRDDAGGIDRGLHQHRFVLGEGLEVIPAVEVHEREHVGGDHAAIARMRGDQAPAPLGIEEVLPGARGLRGRDRLRVVGDDVDGGPQAVVEAVAVLEAGGEGVHPRRGVAHQQLLLLQQHVVAGVGGVDDVDVPDVGLQLLHHPLQDPLRAGPVHLHLHARVGGLEQLRDLLRARERERGVPDDLALLAGRLEPRILRGRRGGGEGQGEDQQRDHESAMAHEGSSRR
jgi:hypothetical protein